MMKKQTKGITLIALVITIIILLILAGITINLTVGQRGIIQRAQDARIQTDKASAEEKVELMLADFVVDNALGTKTLLEYLNEQKEIGEIEEVEDNGDGTFTVEVDGYEITIRESDLSIIGTQEAKGIKIIGTATLETKESVAYGNKVKIKVTASITEGNIVSIKPTNGAKLETDTSATEKTYTVEKNGTYYFEIEASNGKKKVVKVKVDTIIMPTVTASITQVKAKKLTIQVTTDYASGMVTEYKYYVNGAEVNSGTTNTSYTVGGLTPSTKYEVYVVACDNRGEKIESKKIEATTGEFLPPSIGGTVATHTAKPITYSWEELDTLAEIISDHYGTGTNQINNDTAGVTVEMDGDLYTLGLGDYKTLNGKKVRIIGFNHDTLTNKAQYGETKNNTYAGITFEFVDAIAETRISGTGNYLGGWKSCELRGKLNGTIYNSLDNKEHIKQVNKQYIETYNQAGSVKPSEDLLWLLSAAEIWSDWAKMGTSQGDVIAKEGEQYRLFELAGDANLKPLLDKGEYSWWLRSPHRWAAAIARRCKL